MRRSVEDVAALSGVPLISRVDSQREALGVQVEGRKQGKGGTQPPELAESPARGTPEQGGCYFKSILLISRKSFLLADPN